MTSAICFGAIAIHIALLAAGCDGEEDPTASAAQGGQAGSGGSGGTAGSSDGGEASMGGSGGSPACLSCAAAMTTIQSGGTQGKICDDPTSTQLFAALAQCYCAAAVCGGTSGACAAVCDPEPDPEVSQECVDCIVDSFSDACEAQAQACATDA